MSSTWLRGVVGCFLAVAGFVVLAAPAEAQGGGTVTVNVIDRTNQQPVNGARVVVEGTRLTGVTDGRGVLTMMNVPGGSYQVRVLAIGYRSSTQQVTVTAGGTAELSFALTLSAVSLDEIVVTGTGGAVEKRKLGTTLGTVDVSQVREVVPVQDLGSVLQARIPGVRSIGLGGGPGANKDLRIRGTASFTLGQRPVVYVDGVRIDTDQFDRGGWGDGSTDGTACCFFNGGAGADRLSDINPDDIERVEVIKGAAAATLYGTEASNGVIQIFTKRGRNNSAPRWTASYTGGFNRVRNNLDSSEKTRFTGPDGFRAQDPATLINNGMHQNLDMTVQGGGETVSYFIGAGVLYDEGSIQPSDQTRGNIRTNLRWESSDKWAFELNSAFAHNKLNLLHSGNNWTALLGNALIGNPLNATEERPFGEPWVPVASIQEIETRSITDRFTGGVTVNFNPTEQFGHRFTVGLDATNDRRERFYPFGLQYVYVGTDAERNLGFRNFQSWTMDYLGTVGWGLSESIQSDFSFGAQGFFEVARTNIAVGEAFAGEGVSVVSGGANTFAGETFREEINVGLFAQNRFSISDRLFLTAGARLDGNSAFGDNFGLQFYPMGDIAYVLTLGLGRLSSFKLRSALGRSGLAPGAFDQFRTFQPVSVLEEEGGVIPLNPGNADLEPEKTTEFEGGFDAGLFDDRVAVEFTGYRSWTTDALLPIPLPPSQGFTSSQLQNVGSLQNTGWEVKIDAAVIEGDNFRWSVGLNMDGNTNLITDLGLPLELGGAAECNAAGIETSGKRGTGSDGTRAECKLGGRRLNHSVDAIFTRTLTGYDAATNTHSRSDTSNFIGDPLPDWNGSLSNSLEFGAFRLYGLVSWEKGAFFSNGDRPYRVRQSASNEFLQFLNDDGSTTFQSDSTLNYWTLFSAIDKRDHIRLRELSLSYQLPDGLTNALGIGRTTFTATGQNLHWWDDCKCRDPNGTWDTANDADGSFNSDFLSNPSPRQFRFSIRTSF